MATQLLRGGADPVLVADLLGHDDLAARGIGLSLGGQVYDPTDPMGKMFFDILAIFAEFDCRFAADVHPWGHGRRPRQR